MLSHEDKEEQKPQCDRDWLPQYVCQRQACSFEIAWTAYTAASGVLYTACASAMQQFIAYLHELLPMPLTHSRMVEVGHQW